MTTLNRECIQLFRSGVERVLGNWTALKLAVDHGTGGAQSRELAANFIQYIGDIYCEGGHIEPEDICDVLVDVMDTQFNTWCEDNSPDEIAVVLCKLYNLCSQENISELRKEVDNLPLSAASLSRDMTPLQGQNIPGLPPVSEDTLVQDITEMEEVMTQPEEDPGWTQVSRRKKRLQ